MELRASCSCYLHSAQYVYTPMSNEDNDEELPFKKMREHPMEVPTKDDYGNRETDGRAERTRVRGND